MEGWIKLHRKFLEWEWYDDANTMRVFIHCLLSSNWKDKNWQGMKIARGSFFTSYAKIGAGIGLSVQQTRTALGKLKSTNEIDVQSTGKGLLITVCNFATYNDCETVQQQGDNIPSNREITDNQHSQQHGDNRQSTTTEEREEGEETHTQEEISPFGLSLDQVKAAGLQMSITEQITESWWFSRAGSDPAWTQPRANGSTSRITSENWRANLKSFCNTYEEMDRKQKLKNVGSRRSGESSSNRGTANEGKASQYAL